MHETYTNKKSNTSFEAECLFEQACSEASIDPYENDDDFDWSLGGDGVIMLSGVPDALYLALIADGWTRV